MNTSKTENSLKKNGLMLKCTKRGSFILYHNGKRYNYAKDKYSEAYKHFMSLMTPAKGDPNE